MHKILHPRDAISWKEGGRGLASIEDFMDATIQKLKKDQRKTNYNSQLQQYQQK